MLLIVVVVINFISYCCRNC